MKSRVPVLMELIAMGVTHSEKLTKQVNSCDFLSVMKETKRIFVVQNNRDLFEYLLYQECFGEGFSDKALHLRRVRGSQPCEDGYSKSRHKEQQVQRPSTLKSLKMGWKMTHRCKIFLLFL